MCVVYRGSIILPAIYKYKKSLQPSVFYTHKIELCYKIVEGNKISYVCHFVIKSLPSLLAWSGTEFYLRPPSTYNHQQWYIKIV